MENGQFEKIRQEKRKENAKWTSWEILDEEYLVIYDDSGNELNKFLLDEIIENHLEQYSFHERN
ncbi:MAG: hypothetical protein KKH52_04570 [Nanoarchaeota archaeon]|nr:hypothetical protein [Nanoarchaeota archaeon]MBU1974640.1 hypothetical protein [Nanoarchaeota archaeon]